MDIAKKRLVRAAWYTMGLILTAHTLVPTVVPVVAIWFVALLKICSKDLAVVGQNW
jgi:hypothetical protein